jgi:uncharacterized membrane protein
MSLFNRPGTGVSRFTQLLDAFASYAGNANKVLRIKSDETGIEAATVSGTGDVVGPASSTDNAFVRFDGTGGKTVQNSSATLDDSGNATFTSSTLNNTGLKIKDTDASHVLSIVPGSNLTADRTLTITSGDANRTLDISADNVTISSTAATLLDDASISAMLTTLGLTFNTYTPTVTLVGGSGNTVPQYSTNTGIYFKCGSLYLVWIYLTGDGGNEGAGTGQLNISLPATTNASEPVGNISVGTSLNSMTLRSILGVTGPSVSTVQLNYINAGAIASLTGADQNNASRSLVLRFFFYGA